MAFVEALGVFQVYIWSERRLNPCSTNVKTSNSSTCKVERQQKFLRRLDEYLASFQWI